MPLARALASDVAGTAHAAAPGRGECAPAGDTETVVPLPEPPLVRAAQATMPWLVRPTGWLEAGLRQRGGQGTCPFGNLFASGAI